MAHPSLQFGSIIHHHDVPDPQGTPAGPHFAVVLNSKDEIDAGLQDLDLAVITSSFDKPLPAGWFIIPQYIPAKPGGHQLTGLSKLSVVKCTWFVSLPRSECRFKHKHVSKDTALQIQGYYAALAAQARQQHQKPSPSKANPAH